MKIIKLIKEDWLAAISTALCFAAVSLISIVAIEGIMLMISSQIGWSIWAFKKKAKFMIIQNSVLMCIDIFGTYFWITSGKGIWVTLEVLKWITI